MAELKDRVIEALETVIDPELGIDIVNLGLVYDVKMNDEGHAIVEMTLTSMGCPVAPLIIEQVEMAMLTVEEVNEVDVELIWDPPWTKDKMSRYAKIALGIVDYD
ncbi:metal-sulfur cluster assembly factor [Gemella sp. GH3]|uniref:metal-sulfur cluster assembly factor n=1 Tax=unclassified Gemella TaxID=2624949 RepID=UPI0015CFFA8E|nr:MULTISPECIES: metal-sulfur cluster assembly factor [unclassified Gemella]MBF0713724.1 metal-sulfur cluster assembly factor [Gemella sp. GH3.1]NYS50676.1 metal-sulfur cluster assembly factor [Gemella sp. GH3]